ncbi:MAG: hypothetical protein ACERKN_10860 [Velocimicrobium sp.]
MGDVIDSLNDRTYQSMGECYAVRHDGTIEPFKQGESTETIVEGGASIVTNFTLNDPIYKNTLHSDNIIVLYNREPFDNEKNTWDYKYSDNKKGMMVK